MKYSILILILFVFSTANAQIGRSDTEISENIDTRLFHSINRNRSEFLTKFVSISDKSVMPNAIAAPLGLFAISRANNNRYDENTAILMGSSEAFTVGFGYLMKRVIERERPNVTWKYIHCDLENSPTDRYSFPSIHSATAFSMATSLTLRYNDKPFLIAGAYTYAVLIAYGRVYLGVHYPSDVLTGALIGTGSSILMFSLRKEIIKLKSNVFNEEYSDEKGKGINEFVALGGLIGVNVINNFLSGSKNPVLKKTSISTDLSSLSLKINF
jgi:hypothetical protein